ncbi:M2 family metallopeptidase [Bacteroidota bacterium]
MKDELLAFLETYESKVVELSKELSLTYFDASISGKEEDYKKASELKIELDKVYAEKKSFELLKQIKNSDSIDDPVLKRQLDLIYNAYAANQFNEDLLERIINLSNKIEKDFAVFRAEVKGQKFTDNQIDEVLQNSTDSSELKTAWEASKQIGKVVSDDVLEIVKLRNKAAREIGYNNYHEMSLLLNEQNPEDMDKLFDDLNRITKDEFAKLKNEIDDYLSERYNVPVNELMPWHYQETFFQIGPRISEIDFDSYFKDKDLVEITRKYFKEISLDADDLFEKSDLFEKEGKYQHAYCSSIDRAGDVRVLCNIKPNCRWMGAMLHEYGHAVYDKYISPKLPWELRRHAHIFTTEAIALMFGRFVSNPQWLKDVIGISDEEKNKTTKESFNKLRKEQLVFTRWEQVMYRFEREMYKNPEQNLNSLWWNLVEKYQLIKKPEGRDEPDWAAKIHVSLYPAYYHNYMLGELLASQLHHYITTKVIKSDELFLQSFAGNKDVGEYLKNLFFSYGALYSWNELIEIATGEKLNPQYYADQFITK